MDNALEPMPPGPDSPYPRESVEGRKVDYEWYCLLLSVTAVILATVKWFGSALSIVALVYCLWVLRDKGGGAAAWIGLVLSIASFILGYLFYRS